MLSKRIGQKDRPGSDCSNSSRLFQSGVSHTREQSFSRVFFDAHHTRTCPCGHTTRAPIAADDRVVLRGRNFTLPTPLTPEKLKFDQADPQAAFAGKPSPYTGFRMVLPIP